MRNFKELDIWKDSLSIVKQVYILIINALIKYSKSQIKT